MVYALSGLPILLVIVLPFVCPLCSYNKNILFQSWHSQMVYALFGLPILLVIVLPLALTLTTRKAEVNKYGF